MATTETQLLQNAFQEFAKASNSIIGYYNALEGQIRELKREVDEKNRELERSREYLYTILNSLPVGVLVRERDRLLFSNKSAERLGTKDFLHDLGSGSTKEGELRSGKEFLRWKREVLKNGFSGKEIIVLEDVTEMEKMKERLERDERLRAMGEMAARIAHEIKNPLGSMELFLSLLGKERLKVKEKEYVNHVLFGVKTVDRIINNILTYTRPKTLVLTEGRLGRIVEETLEFMSVSITARDIEKEFSRQYDGTSFFDPDLMKLVVMNFVSNAIEAVPPKGVIKVDIRENGEYVALIVSDNGQGMSEEVRRNIFNPFFTTKEKGVGLGLFIVHNIVQTHNGYIEVESIEGVGSSFSTFIPKGRP
jgi:signal transduction histidine kinase